MKLDSSHSRSFGGSASRLGIEPQRRVQIELLEARTMMDATEEVLTADACGPYSVVEGGSVMLSGAGGIPEDGQFTVSWDFDGDGEFGETGTPAARGDEVGANPTFNAAHASAPATLVVVLRVGSGRSFTDDTATIDILPRPSDRI